MGVVMSIIGRKREINLFRKILESDQAEFVAVYGRRRVGKTYLIEHCCSSRKNNYFACTGIKDGKLKDQLYHFITQFSLVFYPGLSLALPRSWIEAFELLTNEIEKSEKSKQIVIFFDELPWLASRKSGFMGTLDHFWNTKWRKYVNLKLIVCGSAASWMLSNLINAKGGLYNRITNSILLEPFTLSETKEFLTYKDIIIPNNQILDIYMVMGGIPFYLNLLDRNKSIIQNINDLCFRKDGLLFNEFDRVFKSLFDSFDLSINIVKNIAEFRYGISFAELVKKTHKKAGGRFTERLDELIATGFIQKFLPYGRKNRDFFYKVVDEYCLFYLRWIEPRKYLADGIDHFSHIKNSPSYWSFAGYAFEGICYKHINKIIEALHLQNVGYVMGHWKYQTLDRTKSGTEIDLLFDRDDEAITLCEIKCTKEPFVINKEDAKNLMAKVDTFKEQTHTKKQVFLSFISSAGVTENVWSKELINNVITLEDFFC